MKEITYIEPSSLAKVVGLIIFGLTFLWLIPTDIFLFKEFILGRSQNLDFIFIWIFLAINPGLTYLIGLLAGYVYNFFAKRFGGLEIEIK